MNVNEENLHNYKAVSVTIKPYCLTDLNIALLLYGTKLMKQLSTIPSSINIMNGQTGIIAEPIKTLE